MKQDETENKKKSQSIFSWLIWWRIDKEELKKQVKEYETLKITQSARGISFLFQLLSVVIATGAILFTNIITVSAFFYVFLYLILGFFIYKGRRWAMIGIMALSTFATFSNFYNSVVANPENGTPIINSSLMWTLFFWTITMHFYYLAFKVEGLRAKDKKELINANNTIAERKSFDELERLAELKNKGVITEEDFNKKKRQILGL